MAPTRIRTSTTQSTLNIDEDSDVEVIEDSEPERAERREQERVDKRRLERAVPSSRTLEPVTNSTPSWISRSTQLTQSTASASSSIVSSKPPDDDSQIMPTPLVTSSAPTRQVAPPPWLVPKNTPAPEPKSPVRPASSTIQRTKSSSQPSPVKQLDINSFVYHKRTSGARTSSYSTSSRSASLSKVTDGEGPSTSKVPPAPSAKSSSSPKTFHLGATNGPLGADVTFSAGQIASITGCVVCGNSWTVRKQPKSKWAHITACARKNGCGTEALHLKIVAATVEASEEKARAAAKGKEKEKEPAGPQSLLAHTVQERAPPQRRGRRKAPGPPTLQSVEEAQKSILQRSTLLLGTDVPQQDENEPRSTTLNQRPESEGDHFDIPATQVFAPSKIGGNSKFFGSTTSMFNTDSASGLLYAEQQHSFTLGSRQDSPPLSVTSDHDIHDSAPRSPPLSIHSSIISINSSTCDSVSDELKALHDRTRSPDSSGSVLILDSSVLEPVRAASPALNAPQSDDDDGWDSRDGVYMWEDYVEEVERPISPTDSLVDGLLALTMQESQGKTARTGHRSRISSPHGKPKSFVSSRSPTNDDESCKKRIGPPSPSSLDNPTTTVLESKSNDKRSGSSDQPPPPAAPSKTKPKPKPKPKSASPRPRKTRTKKKTTIYAPEDIQDDEESAPSKDIDAQLLAMITGDKTLYLRILRYEPIKFEDIFEMALANGVPKHGLQIKLKAFLDSQCINFYSGDNLGRRKRH